METQTYYQKSDVAERIVVPTALRRWLVGALGVYIVLLAALPVQMLVSGDALADSIMRNTPTLAPEQLGFVVIGVHVYTIGLHLLNVVLAVWFVAKVLKGRRWARIALTAYLVIATGFSLISAAAGTEYLWNVIACDGLHVVMLVLLWLPKPVRGFFGAHREADRARSTRDVAPRA